MKLPVRFLAIGYVLAILIYSYMSFPVLNYGFSELPVVLMFFSIPFFTMYFGKQFVNPKDKPILKIIMGIGVAAGFYAIIWSSIVSWSLFRADDYRNLIGSLEVGESFASEVAPVSTDNIRIVDESVAQRLGDKVMGEKPSLGSQTYLGKFHIQKVKDKLYWVAPLLHSGFLKWLTNTEGTPGYVMVSATNERDVKLVQEVNGKQVNLKYQTAAFAFDDLQRHVYFNGYLTKGLADFTFEIDDEGNPFWVITQYKKTIGFLGKDAVGVVVVNAQNGEIQNYSVADAPLWIDRIQPEDFIETQLDDWGEFVHGYFNFSNKDKLTTTPGMSLVYGEDNRSYWYTGLTSVGADEGTVGFVLVDTRTKEAKWYRQTGATEYAAQRSAEGKVQEKGYDSSFPITYNINGVPTYVMSLKDNSGLIKMMALVSVQDYTIVGAADNLQEALREYKSSLNSVGNSIRPTSESKLNEIKGRVLRVAEDVNGGTTFYYLLLKNEPRKLFVASSSVSQELPITQAGDSVTVYYDEAMQSVVDIMSFDNLEIGLEKDKK
ncbi:hypothetical protein WAF17_11405 [Bernardetia sp. ABR2-2B]|uniref:hypothetical protein n=1 Tax=Bernardetia sp. ABR2-2B TaxID=3127472 RepID=UPI0030D55F28